MTITNSTKDSVETTTKKVLIMTTLTIPDSVLFLSMRAIKMTMKNYMYHRHYQKHYILATTGTAHVKRA